MLYLSQLELNPCSRQVQSELRDPYEMHRTFSRTFGDGPGDFENARCLFRVEESPADGEPIALVQSRIPPNWNALAGVQNYLLAPARTKEFSPSLRQGQRLSFRLLANPTVCRDGKRRGLLSEEDQTGWIHRKAQAGGFALRDLRIQNAGKMESRRPGTPPAVFARARFDGVLVIEDPALFLQTLHAGIGRAKGYGFGLLSIARA